MPVPVHLGLRVMLTRNLNKGSDYVNGMEAATNKAPNQSFFKRVRRNW